jgi:hypothetical protein
MIRWYSTHHDLNATRQPDSGKSVDRACAGEATDAKFDQGQQLEPVTIEGDADAVGVPRACSAPNPVTMTGAFYPVISA